MCAARPRWAAPPQQHQQEQQQQYNTSAAGRRGTARRRISFDSRSDSDSQESSLEGSEAALARAAPSWLRWARRVFGAGLLDPSTCSEESSCSRAPCQEDQLQHGSVPHTGTQPQQHRRSGTGTTQLPIDTLFVRQGGQLGSSAGEATGAVPRHSCAQLSSQGDAFQPRECLPAPACSASPPHECRISGSAYWAAKGQPALGSPAMQPHSKAGPLATQEPLAGQVASVAEQGWHIRAAVYQANTSSREHKCTAGHTPPALARCAAGSSPLAAVAQRQPGAGQSVRLVFHAAYQGGQGNWAVLILHAATAAAFVAFPMLQLRQQMLTATQWHGSRVLLAYRLQNSPRACSPRQQAQALPKCNSPKQHGCTSSSVSEARSRKARTAGGASSACHSAKDSRK